MPKQVAVGILLCVGAHLLGAGGAEAWAREDAVVRGELGRSLDEAVLRASAGGFWGAVLVAREGEVLLAKGYGAADYASKPNGPDTLFEIASASKQVAATAILKLAQDGRLSLDDPVTKFFRGVASDKEAVTIAHLLHHTSGLSPRLGVSYASPIARREYAKQMLAPPLVAEPGAAFSYSNVGYALLAAVVEEVTNKSFEDWVHRHLFKPADMDDSGFIGERRLIRSPRISTRRKDGDDDGTAADWHYGWGYRGMGGVVTTVLDLLKWDRALRGDDLLDAEHKEILYTPALEGYACGWRVNATDRGTRKAHHSGGVAGYACQVARWLEDDVCIFILSNGASDIYGIERALEGLLFERPAVEARLDVGEHELSEYGALVLEDLGFRAEAAGGGVRLGLHAGDHVLASIDLPTGVARRLAEELGRAIEARRSDAPPDASTDGGLYLGPYPREKTLHLTELLGVRIQPLYRGRGADGETIIDKRPVFILEDGRYRQWPVMVKMNLETARTLLQQVTEALGG